MSKQIKQFYEFGVFRIDPAQRVLLREGEPIDLPPKVFDTLLALVEHSGQIVEKDKLLEEVWHETFVEENNLTQYISALRKTLGDDRHGQHYIKTIPRRGYRFAAEVHKVWDEEGEVTNGNHTTIRLTVREEIEEISEAKTASVADATSAAVAPVPRLTLKHGLPIVAILAVALAAAIVWTMSRTKPADSGGATPLPRTIAVLPFKTLDASDSDDYLGLGMADTLITKLSSLSQINIRPTSAVRKYAAQEQNSLAAGREQKVDAVLEGSIQRSGDKLRVTVRLLSVGDGSPLWAYQCDEVCTDLFALQDAISEQVAGALMLKLTGQEKARLTKRHTESIEAYQAYLKGRYFWNKRTPEDFKKAAEQFRQAIAIDPNYALGYAGLADCYFFNGEAAKTVAALSKALELDDTLVEALTTQAYYLSVRWDWERAERLFKRAIELNPNYPPAHHWYAFHLTALGRFPEAIEEINRAKEIDPLSLIINTDVGQILYFSRQYDQAIEAYRKALEMQPNFSVARWRLGEAYEQKGMVEEAIAEYQQTLSVSKNPTIEVWLGHAYAVSGKKDKAQKILAELQKRHKREPNWFYEIALIYAGLGEREQAFAWLEKAYENKEEASLALLKVEPMLDSLRSEPRFNELLKRLGLAE